MTRSDVLPHKRHCVVVVFVISIAVNIDIGFSVLWRPWCCNVTMTPSIKTKQASLVQVKPSTTFQLSSNNWTTQGRNNGGERGEQFPGCRKKSQQSHK